MYRAKLNGYACRYAEDRGRLECGELVIITKTRRAVARRAADCDTYADGYQLLHRPQPTPRKIFSLQI